MVNVERFMNVPLITPDMDASLEGNINGPSLIQAPDWLERPLGRYYLYFAHHSGKFIRLAYADRLEGPWRIFSQGTLQTEQSHCRGHIASPDVHVDDANRRIVMFYHGHPRAAGEKGQRTFAAVSEDGIHFAASEKRYGRAYWRCFPWNGYYYAVTMSGTVYRGSELLGDYEAGPDLFRDSGFRQRHMAVKISGETLYLFYSIKEDTPEHIVVSKLDLRSDWKEWLVTSYDTVLQPELEYEGAELPLEPSRSGAVHTPVRQLRDPGIYEEGGRTYLLYSIAGESGLAMVKLSGFEERG